MASTINIETRQPLYLIAGVSAGFSVGGKTYVNPVSDDNPSLAGWDFTVDVRASGILYPGIEFTFDGTDTITVTLPGYEIGDGEKWIIEFQPKAADSPIPSTTQTEYSNGFKVADVMAALMNRRRWRQPTRADFPFTLVNPNVWADDDLYSPLFEAMHKIVTPYNIWQVQEDKDITTGQFNTYLQQLQRDIVLKCLNSVFNKREYLEKKLLFERFGRQDYINVNEGRFVGVRLLPAKAFDISVQIDNVILKFDRNVSFNMYLFHDSQPGISIRTIPVTAQANAQTVINIGKVLSYAGAGNKSGVYYFGYFQEDLGSAQAINEIIQNFNPLYNFGCVPIELNKVGSGIDVNQVSFTIKTHGINLQLSAFRDYTQLIVDNAYLFDNLIGLQMAADVIEMIQNTVRSNKDQRITAELTKMLYSDLNLASTTEESPFSIGLKSRITKEAYRVKCEFFPKRKPVSITHDTESCNIYGVAPAVLDVFSY